LFLGIELVDQELHPLAEKTAYVVNRMKEYGILMSSDGPQQNVLKIKPPLTFTKENAKEVIFYLQKVLAEDFMKII
jgi:4-aminobutyrate aminotransferase-like enzyme